MLDQGIIKQSNSPWMAPTVFIPPKKSGEIRLCVDYRALNKKTSQDAYPLPLPNAVQDYLTGSTIFTTLNLRCGYWQVPVWPGDQEKTAFCPGPGMGLYEFCCMPFGLSGALGSFQRLMDKIGLIICCYISRQYSYTFCRHQSARRPFTTGLSQTTLSWTNTQRK